MPTTPVAGLRYPTSGDSTNVWQYWQNLATDVDRKVIVPFATEAARDTAIPAPTDGMVCWITNLACWTERANGKWNRRYPAEAYGALCKPVKLSREAGGGMKYAAPTGAGYFEMGRTPDIVVPANRMVELTAPVGWVNGGARAATGVRFERVRTDAAGFDLQTLEQSFYVDGTSLADSTVPVTHHFVDQITTAGTYNWRLAAKTDQAGNTVGIPENAWAYLTVKAIGPIPSI